METSGKSQVVLPKHNVIEEITGFSLKFNDSLFTPLPRLYKRGKGAIPRSLFGRPDSETKSTEQRGSFGTVDGKFKAELDTNKEGDHNGISSIRSNSPDKILDDTCPLTLDMELQILKRYDNEEDGKDEEHAHEEDVYSMDRCYECGTGIDYCICWWSDQSKAEEVDSRKEGDYSRSSSIRSSSPDIIVVETSPEVDSRKEGDYSRSSSIRSSSPDIIVVETSPEVDSRKEGDYSRSSSIRLSSPDIIVVETSPISLDLISHIVKGDDEDKDDGTDDEEEDDDCCVVGCSACSTEHCVCLNWSQQSKAEELDWKKRDHTASSSIHSSNPNLVVSGTSPIELDTNKEGDHNGSSSIRLSSPDKILGDDCPLTLDLILQILKDPNDDNEDDSKYEVHAHEEDVYRMDQCYACGTHYCICWSLSEQIKVEGLKRKKSPEDDSRSPCCIPGKKSRSSMED